MSMIKKLSEELLICATNYLNYHDFNQFIVDKCLRKYFSNHKKVKQRKYKFYIKLVKIHIYQIQHILRSKIKINGCTYSQKILKLFEDIDIGYIMNNEYTLIEEIKRNHLYSPIKNKLLQFNTFEENIDSIIKIKNQVN